MTPRAVNANALSSIKKKQHQHGPLFRSHTIEETHKYPVFLHVLAFLFKHQFSWKSLSHIVITQTSPSFSISSFAKINGIQSSVYYSDPSDLVLLMSKKNSQATESHSGILLSQKKHFCFPFPFRLSTITSTSNSLQRPLSASHLLAHVQSIGLVVGSVDAPVVLDSPGLESLPRLLVVPGASLLDFADARVPGCVGTVPWAGDGRCVPGGGGRVAGAVVDSEGLVHLAVVLLKSLPGLGGIGRVLGCGWAGNRGAAGSLR